MALKNIPSLVPSLLMCSLFLALLAGSAHALACGPPDYYCGNGVCCTYTSMCGPAADPCNCGEDLPDLGQCCAAGSLPGQCNDGTYSCAPLDDACCGTVPGCFSNPNNGDPFCDVTGVARHCNSMNNNKGACNQVSPSCVWRPQQCANMGQVCGAGSPVQMACCPGQGACSPVGNTWKCSCPAAGGDCSSNTCCPGLTCQASSKLCCYVDGGSCAVGGNSCCSGSECDAATLTCKSCGGKACTQASECCTGYACEPKPKGSPTKQCCIADNSATSCAYGSDCCSGICTGHVCQPAMCDVVPTIASYTDITLDPKFGEINAYTYNLSEKDYVKTGLPNALLFLVNLTDQSNIRICYTVTDSTGHMQMAYDPAVPGCTDYWFIFCPRGDATLATDDGRVSRETCLNSTKIDYAKLIYPVPTACEGSPPAPASYLDHILSHNELYFCNKVTKDYAPLCWPLMLILGLLLGASFAAGKNPFHAFDFSSPRMNRGRQYSMRVQNKSFDFLSYLMGAATTAMSAKSMAKALSKGGGGFGAMLKAEAKSAFNPGAAIKDLKGSLANMKSGLNGLAKADANLTKAEANLKKAIQSGNSAAIAKAQSAYTAARSAFTSALNIVSKSGIAGNPEVKKIIDAANNRLDASAKLSFPPAPPRVATFDDGPQRAATSTGSQQAATSTATGSPQVNMSVKGMIQGSRGAIIKGMRQKHRKDRKELINETKKNVADSKLAKKEIKKELRNAPPEEKARLRERLGAVKQELNISRMERSQARSWKVGAEKPKSVQDLIKETKDKIKEAENKKDFATLSKEKDHLASLESIGKTRAQFRAERKNESAIAKAKVVETKGVYDALVKSGAGEKEIAQAKHDYDEAKALRFKMNNWVYGDKKPELDKQVLSVDAKNIAEFGREMKRNGVALSDTDLMRIMDGEKVALSAENTGKKFTVETKGGKIVATELWQSTSEWKQVRSAAIERARSGTGGQERRPAISAARDIGRMPSTGISGATASAYGARDTIGTIASLFRKDTWNMSGSQDRMASSGVDEYFKYAANANSTGQAFTMLLGFILKKMMENAKLRSSEKQQGVRVQTSMSFRNVNKSIETLFRVYSVMSVLSAYTKGLGAATGSSALKGGIGFMETINSAGFGSIGKYNINAATLASWVDPSLSQQMVGGGLPFPFSKLQGAVSGSVAGGAVLVQKFSDLLARDVRVSYTDGEKTFVLATEETGSKKGTLMMDGPGNFLVGRCVGKDGQLIEGYAGKPLQISDMKRTYVVVKDGNYMQMNEREASRYDRLQADRAGTLAEGNAYALRIGAGIRKLGDTLSFTPRKDRASTEAEEYMRKPVKTDADIENLSKNTSAQKIVVRSSRQNALELLSRLPDMSGMNGEEQMKIIRLRSTLETHAAFTDDLLGLIRGTDASKAVLGLIQSHKTRESLFAELDSNKRKLEVLEAKQAKAEAEHRELSEKDCADKFTYEENVKQLAAAVGFFDAIKASGLEMNKDVIDNIGKANGKIAANMMRALDFQDSYARCYSAAIVMGFEDRMPDITAFQQKGAEALRNHDYSKTLDQMANQLSTPASVRFKDRQSSDSYRKSLARVMDAGQIYLVTQSIEDKQAYAEALTNNEITLLGAVKFDGRFAEVQNEIVQKLEQASKQRSENLDRYIQYVDDLVRTTVALHQTSDSFINAQMAKSGWQDRAPYQSSPETEALISTQVSSDYVQGVRPSMETGFSSPTWFGSRSGGLYMKGAEFNVSPFNPSGESTPASSQESIIANTKYIPAIEKALQKDTIPVDIKEQMGDISAIIKDYEQDPSKESFAKLQMAYFLATKAPKPAKKSGKQGKS